MAEKKQTNKQIKVGDSVDLGESAYFVRLPDGAVVSGRGEFVFMHEGEHVVGDKVYNVAEAD